MVPPAALLDTRAPDRSRRARRSADAGVPCRAAPDPVGAQRSLGRRTVRPDRDRALGDRALRAVDLAADVRADGPGPRPVPQPDARGRAPPAVRRPDAQRLGRTVAARLPVVHLDRRLPAGAHGPPPRGVRARRAGHRRSTPATRSAGRACVASCCATPRVAPGWRLLRDQVRGVPLGQREGAPHAVEDRGRAGRPARRRDRVRPLVAVPAVLAAAVPDRVARDQPAPLDRRARRHARLGRSPADDALRAPAPARQVPPRAVPHRLAPRPPRRSGVPFRNLPTLHRALERVRLRRSDTLEYRSYPALWRGAAAAGERRDLFPLRR